MEKKVSSNNAGTRTRGMGTGCFMLLIMCAIGYPIVYRVSMMIVNTYPTIFTFAVALSVVGCTSIWFALSHAEVVSTEVKPRKDGLSAGHDHREEKEPVPLPF